MRFARLNDLPPPPQGKTGWPWTCESPARLPGMDNGCEWPKISIVTPSYNQGRFVEETIRSVLLQNYPNLEYIVVDGGSADESVEIIKKYEPWLAYWVSERDGGQSDAINKGFALATGDIGGWLNSDDLFNPGTLSVVASCLEKDKLQWLIGAGQMMNEQGKNAKKIPSTMVSHKTFQTWLNNFFAQPSTFWTMQLWSAVGGVDNNLHYTMDIDLWRKFYDIGEPKILSQNLSSLRAHGKAKTTNYSDSYGEFLTEYKAWLVDKYIKNGGERSQEFISSLMDEFVFLQLREELLQRIKKHLILGKINKLWSTFINPGVAL